MERDAEAAGGGLEADLAALGVAGVEEPAGCGVPERGGHLVDQLLALLGRGRPDRVHADGRHGGHALVGGVGDFLLAEEAELLDQLVDRGPVIGNSSMATVAGRSGTGLWRQPLTLEQ